jgi:hypothetical protein
MPYPLLINPTLRIPIGNEQVVSFDSLSTDAVDASLKRGAVFLKVRTDNCDSLNHADWSTKTTSLRAYLTEKEAPFYNAICPCAALAVGFPYPGANGAATLLGKLPMQACEFLIL